jgi:hypothetical protein
MRLERPDAAIILETSSIPRARVAGSVDKIGPVVGLVVLVEVELNELLFFLVALMLCHESSPFRS